MIAHFALNQAKGLIMIARLVYGGVLLTLGLFISHCSHAGPYVELTGGVESKRQVTSYSVGYAHNGWFGEFTKPRFSDVPTSQFVRDDGVGADGLGGGETMTYENRENTTVSVAAFHVGKMFSFGSLAIGPFAGVHSYKSQTIGGSRLVRIDQATGEEIIDRSLYVNDAQSGHALTFGIIGSVVIAPHLSLVGRVTQYQGIDKLTAEIGLRGEF